jgi:ribosomal subunit interface protein
MRITIKAVNLDLTPSIRIYIEEKIGSLSHYMKRFEVAGGPEVSVEIARTTHHHHKGDVFKAEVHIMLPGKVLRAERITKDVRTAIDQVKNTLRLEIAKYRTMHMVHRILRRTR